MDWIKTQILQDGNSGGECWAFRKEHLKKMIVADCLRWMGGNSLRGRIRIVDIRRKIGVADLRTILWRIGYQFGHLRRRRWRI